MTFEFLLLGGCDIMEEHSFFLGDGYIVGSNQDPHVNDQDDIDQDESVIIPSELCSCGKSNWSKLHDKMVMFNSSGSDVTDIERLIGMGHSVVRVYNAPILKKPTRKVPAGEAPRSLKRTTKNYFRLAHIEWNDIHHGLHNYRSTQVIPIRLVGYDILMHSALIQYCYAFHMETKIINICHDLCTGTYGNA